MESAGDWCLIESDPGLLTQLIWSFGAKGVQVEEFWSMNANMFEQVGRPIYGVIFLFKYVPNEEPSGPIVTDDRLSTIYFAKQVINNACATIALISLLLNCNHPDIDIGPELKRFKEFTISFDPRMRGLALSNSQTIRQAHNSMTQQSLFDVGQKVSSADDQAFHFVSYMPINGRLYELDGLREGPIDHGPINPDQDWLNVLQPILFERISKYKEGDINFNLMGLIDDKKMKYERQVNELLANTPQKDRETDQFREALSSLKMNLQYEDYKRFTYKQEMARRKHNYLPFIITLLQCLGEKKKLLPLLERMKKRKIPPSA